MRGREALGRVTGGEIGWKPGTAGMPLPSCLSFGFHAILDPPSSIPGVPAMKRPDIREIRKQVSVFMPLSDWRAIRKKAARQRIPMTELCRRWVEPKLHRLRRGPDSSRRSD